MSKFAPFLIVALSISIAACDSVPSGVTAIPQAVVAGAGSSRVAARLSPNVDSSALGVLLARLPANAHQLVRNQFLDDGVPRAMKFGGDSSIARLARGVYPMTAEVPVELLDRTVRVWRKPITIVDGVVAGNTTVQVAVGSTEKADVITLAPDHRTAAHLSVALQAVAKLRGRAGKFSGRTLTATLRDYPRETPPPLWNAYLTRQLSRLESASRSTSSASIVVQPLSGN